MKISISFLTEFLVSTFFLISSFQKVQTTCETKPDNLKNVRNFIKKILKNSKDNSKLNLVINTKFENPEQTSKKLTEETSVLIDSFYYNFKV